MKRLVPIPAILFTFSSLTAQPIQVSNDSLIFNLPVKFEEVELPPYWEHQIEKKDAPRLSYKRKIGELIVIGATMYVFRDDLRKWSNKNDKAAHLFLGYGTSHYFGYKFALGFLLAIELTQADDFGIRGRYEDTAADLFVGCCGVAFSIKF